MPIKEKSNWPVFLLAVAILGLCVAAWHFGWLSGLSAWFDQNMGNVLR